MAASGRNDGIAGGRAVASSGENGGIADGHEAESARERPAEKIFYCHRGKVYFSRKTERTFYMLLTVVMILMGLAAKIGLL